MEENGTSATISVQSASDPPWSSADEVVSTQVIGSGCLALNFCSERGRVAGRLGKTKPIEQCNAGVTYFIAGLLLIVPVVIETKNQLNF